MLISRASMKQQMKGNRMKKKPVQKKKIGKLLETFSPAYSIMKGKGPISNLVASGLGGVALKPFAEKQREKRKKRDMEMRGSNRMTEMQRMMAGGPIKRKRSIDGCAMRGKTRAV